MGIETSRWDTAEFLDSREAILAYLEAVFEDGDPEPIALPSMTWPAPKISSATHRLSQSDISSAIATAKAVARRAPTYRPSRRR